MGVGMHLVIRPLVRWGIRSFLMPSKQYIEGPKPKKDAVLESEQQIETELMDKKSKGKSSKNKKLRNFSNVNGGIAGSYSEVVCTFGSLAGISYVAHPQNVLLYFGIAYPSMPFILRWWHTLNDKKQKITLARSLRLTGKSLIVTSGFGVSMALVGAIQGIPFFNIFCLAFWDCFADIILSDG